MPEIESMAEMTEKQIDILKKTCQATLEFVDRMEKLGQFPERVDITSSIGQIWKVFSGDIKNSIELDICALFMVDDDTHEFVLREVDPPDNGTICKKEIDLQIECGTFPWVINRRQPAIVPSLSLRNKKTVIMLPLSTSKKTLGVVLIFTSRQESSITLEELKFLAMLAKQSSLVMENTILYDRLRKEHESLKKARNQILLSEKLASIGRLTSGASHEILNPLNIISGHLQLLQMDKNISPRTIRYLNIIGEQSDRIERIVKGLSEFSRNVNPQTEQIKINDLIKKVLSLIKCDVRFDGIEIVKKLDPDLSLIMGDNAGISQVLISILYNAGDSMPEGGTVIITSGNVSRIKQLPGKTGLLEIGFQDTGCGIPKENLNKIFDPFFTTKEANGKTGLGLSISYGIIQDHGGTIQVESKVDGGTKFLIYLPISLKEK